MISLLQIDSVSAAQGLKDALTSHLGLLGGILFSAVAGAIATAGSKAKGWVAGHKWVIPVAQIPLALATTKLVALGFPEFASAINNWAIWVGVAGVTGATSVGLHSAVKNTTQAINNQKLGG